jgi:outer membrane lipoprotein-sorting protein
MFIKKITILVLLFLFSALYSQDIFFNQVLSNLQHHHTKIETMSAEIAMIVGTTQVPLWQKGTFHFESPDKCRIDFTLPQRQCFIYDDDEILLLSPGSTKYKKIDNSDSPFASYYDMYYYNYLKNLYFKVIGTNENIITFSGYFDQDLTQRAFEGGYDTNICVLTRVSLMTSDKNSGQIYSRIENKYKKIDDFVIPYKVIVQTSLSAVASKTVIELRNIKINEDIDRDVWKEN